jgi:RNA polymerase sigma factor for flagellar operon FliA
LLEQPVMPGTHAAAARHQLITEHMPMARRIARKVARRMPDNIRHEDLESAALVGLCEAADRYDHTRPNAPDFKGSFVAFAAKRIRGAVLDELRRGDLMPRRARSAANKLGSAVSSLERRLGRTPEENEVAKELGVSLAAFRECFAGLVPVRVVELPQASEIIDSSSSPMAELERSEAIRRVRTALGTLAERDALVLSLYYVEDFSYIEIGEVLGVSESRVCQLHARALNRLRETLETAN